ncbi:MAG: hypothetical protein IPJ50_19365 [Betaproteobacteria bacterium]|nr:hypothetical protein [Betaproteobacteria bacterium]
MALKWDSLTGLLTTAAGAVTLVFGLFNSVLADLVPPIQSPNPQTAAGLASLLALAVLLGLALLMRRRPSIAYRRGTAIGAGLAIAAAGVWLAVYLGEFNDYVYSWPEVGSGAAQDGSSKPKRHVRGDFTAFGLELQKTLSVAGAVEHAGGLAFVQKNELLWSERSQKATETRLLWHYIAVTTLFTGGVFALALAHVFRRQEAAKQS